MPFLEVGIGDMVYMVLLPVAVWRVINLTISVCCGQHSCDSTGIVLCTEHPGLFYKNAVGPRWLVPL